MARKISNPLRVMAYIHEAFAEGSESSDPFFRLRVGSGTDAHEASVSRDGKTVAFASVSGPTVSYETEMQDVVDDNGNPVTDDDGNATQETVADDDGNPIFVTHECNGLADATLQLLQRAGIEGASRAIRFYTEGPTNVDRVIAAGASGDVLAALALMQELGVTQEELEAAKQ